MIFHKHFTAQVPCVHNKPNKIPPSLGWYYKLLFSNKFSHKRLYNVKCTIHRYLRGSSKSFSLATISSDAQQIASSFLVDIEKT